MSTLYMNTLNFLHIMRIDDMKNIVIDTNDELLEHFH